MSILKYVILPFAAWIISGSIKFAINTLRYGEKAKALIGYGGFPSTHSTIISSAVFLIGFSEGFDTPVFSLGLAVLLLFTIDAHGLRNKVGAHARILNELQSEEQLREGLGHSWLEIIGGVILGAVLAYFANNLCI